MTKGAPQREVWKASDDWQDNVVRCGAASVPDINEALYLPGWLLLGWSPFVGLLLGPLCGPPFVSFRCYF